MGYLIFLLKKALFGELELRKKLEENSPIVVGIWNQQQKIYEQVLEQIKWQQSKSGMIESNISTCVYDVIIQMILNRMKEINLCTLEDETVMYYLKEKNKQYRDQLNDFIELLCEKKKEENLIYTRVVYAPPEVLEQKRKEHMKNKYPSNHEMEIQDEL